MSGQTVTERVRLLRPAGAVDYVMKRVQPDQNGCWIWHGAISRSGYGRVHGPSWGHWAAHRMAYEAFVGPIPEGLHLDHLCRVRRCVNPCHLDPVTNAENARRSPITLQGANIRKTSCRRGHPLTEDNVYVWRGHRRCRECKRLRDDQEFPRRASRR